MAISRIPGGGTAAIFGAVGVALALGTLALIAPAQADPPAAAPMPATPTAIMPPATPPAPTAVTPPHPAHNIVPAAIAKRPPAPTRGHTQPLIPPAALPGQLDAPPSPRPPLSLQTDLLPLGSLPTVTTPAKLPAS